MRGRLVDTGVGHTPDVRGVMPCPCRGHGQDRLVNHLCHSSGHSCKCLPSRESDRAICKSI
eukprot:11072748-Alexandrium_andersonii.AAC.1